MAEKKLDLSTILNNNSKNLPLNGEKNNDENSPEIIAEQKREELEAEKEINESLKEYEDSIQKNDEILESAFDGEKGAENTQKQNTTTKEKVDNDVPNNEKKSDFDKELEKKEIESNTGEELDALEEKKTIKLNTNAIKQKSSGGIIDLGKENKEKNTKAKEVISEIESEAGINEKPEDITSKVIVEDTTSTIEKDSSDELFANYKSDFDKTKDKEFDKEIKEEVKKVEEKKETKEEVKTKDKKDEKKSKVKKTSLGKIGKKIIGTIFLIVAILLITGLVYCYKDEIKELFRPSPIENGDNIPPQDNIPDNNMTGDEQQELDDYINEIENKPNLTQDEKDELIREKIIEIYFRNKGGI